MKLIGLQRVEGGVAIGLPSGRHVLVALPKEPKRAALMLGERLFKLLDDDSEPPAQRVVATRPPPSHAPDPYDDLVTAVHGGINAGRTLSELWRNVRGGHR